VLSISRNGYNTTVCRIRIEKGVQGYQPRQEEQKRCLNQEKGQGRKGNHMDRRMKADMFGEKIIVGR